MSVNPHYGDRFLPFPLSRRTAVPVGRGKNADGRLAYFDPAEPSGAASNEGMERPILLR